jgi:hypothetical protein
VKITKYKFAKRKLAFIGHEISADGVAKDSSKIQAIKNWTVSSNVKEVRTSLCMVGYYWRFVKRLESVVDLYLTCSKRDCTN